ncbi:MAG: cupin domain-containing protein [Angelakisella sp.]|nr:cupin domain-containing protein [Angelakisella sp.]
MNGRFFTVAEVVAEKPANATKYLLYENERTNGVVWYVPTGKEVPRHYHPDTDDTWIILSGSGKYYLKNGAEKEINGGMVISAAKGEVHGAICTGAEPLIFVAISAPLPSKMILVE